MSTETKSIADLTEDKLQMACGMLKTIAHPVRMAILDLLDKHQQLNVGELQEKLGIEQAALSHHLINMKNKNILQCHRDGKNMVYFLKEKRILKILDCIAQCACD